MITIHTEPKISRVAYYLHMVMRGLVLVSIGIFLSGGDWGSAVSALFILLLMLVPYFLKEGYRLYLPVELDLAIVAFIFFSLFLGSLSNFYEKFAWFDGLLHFQSGVLLGVVGFVVVYLLNAKKTERLHLSPGFVAVFSVCFSLSLSVVWEVYEFIADTWFGYTMQKSGLPDTMGDLIVNAIGALIIAVVAYLWMKRRQKIPFAPKFLQKYSL